MKRALEVLSVVLILVGIELTTGSLSYALARLERVYRALSVGNEPEVSLVRFGIGALMVILGAVIMAVLVWARVSSRFIGAVSFCPHCGGKTTRIHRRSRHRLLGMILGMPVTRRKCSDCGWRGLTALT